MTSKIFKTEYEILLELLSEKGRISILSENDSNKILKEIFDEMKDDRHLFIESERELQNIVLNS